MIAMVLEFALFFLVLFFFVPGALISIRSLHRHLHRKQLVLQKSIAG